MGFDAYGMTDDMPDPMVHSINVMLDHLNAVDEKLNGMCGALKELGSDYCNQQLPELNAELLDDVEQ
jgi:serine O-acetyltransferase